MVNKPILVTSAIDPDTENMANDPWTVESYFGHGVATVVDMGEVPGGVSSIVDLTVAPPEIFRVGLGDVSDLE
jgi:tRNA A37 threonylcarbamoyladenosine synthetase subunit TsaC/SUA5/YrdC